MLLELTYEINPETNKKRSVRKYKCDYVNCGKNFTILNGDLCNKRRLRATQYCSKECVYEHRKQRRRHKICANPKCNKIVWESPSQNRKYCSKNCFVTHTEKKCVMDGCSTVVHITNRRGYCKNHASSGYERENKNKIYDRLGRQCVCCGERDQMYLQIDHVFNDGAQHRKEYHESAKTISSHQLLKYLDKNPDGLQVLCCNCNFAKKICDGKLYKPTKFTRRSAKQREVTK